MKREKIIQIFQEFGFTNFDRLVDRLSEPEGSEEIAKEITIPQPISDNVVMDIDLILLQHFPEASVDTIRNANTALTELGLNK